jgi:RNA recognition motif-containing protein
MRRSSAESLARMFQERPHTATCGAVTSAVTQMDDKGRSKGFGFVNFESHDQAQVAVEVLHDSEYKGRKLFVSRAQKKAEREDELRKTYEAAKQEKMSKYQGVNVSTFTSKTSRTISMTRNFVVNSSLSVLSQAARLCAMRRGHLRGLVSFVFRLLMRPPRPLPR